MTYQPSRDAQELAARLSRLESGAKTRTSQLAFSSIEDGAITSMDYADQATGLYGRQFDGSDMALSLRGVAPLTPTQPVLTASPGQLKVRWDGEFVESPVLPTDFARVEVHISTDPAITAETADTLRATIETPRGGELDVTLQPDVVHYVRLVARNLAGGRGAASTVATGTPGAILDAALLDAISADVEEANTAALAAKAATDGWTFGGTVSINGGEIRADTVDAVQLKAGSVVAGKLAANAVLAGNIKAGEITAGKLAAASVIAGDLAANSVLAGNIVAGAITADKLDADAINGRVITGSTVQTAEEGPRMVLRPGMPSESLVGDGVFEMFSGAVGEELPAEVYSTFEVLSPEFQAADLVMVSPKVSGREGRAKIILAADSGALPSTALIRGGRVRLEGTGEVKIYSGTTQVNGTRVEVESDTYDTNVAGVSSLRSAANVPNIGAPEEDPDYLLASQATVVTVAHANAGTGVRGTGVDRTRVELTAKDFENSTQAQFILEPGGITATGDVAIQGAVRVSGKVVQSGTYGGWTSPTLGGSWANYGGAFATCAYKLLPDGFVQLRGLIKSGTSGSAVFTLPVGLRPAGNELFSGVASGGGLADVRVLANGNVVVNGYLGTGNNGYVSLTSVRFEPAA